MIQPRRNWAWLCPITWSSGGGNAAGRYGRQQHTDTQEGTRTRRPKKKVAHHCDGPRPAPGRREENGRKETSRVSPPVGTGKTGPIMRRMAPCHRSIPIVIQGRTHLVAAFGGARPSSIRQGTNCRCGATVRHTVRRRRRMCRARTCHMTSRCQGPVALVCVCTSAQRRGARPHERDVSDRRAPPRRSTLSEDGIKAFLHTRHVGFVRPCSANAHIDQPAASGLSRDAASASNCRARSLALAALRSVPRTSRPTRTLSDACRSTQMAC
ncbi:hypothetical protein SEVIR_7G214450v4 [Setaria viridis]